MDITLPWFIKALEEKDGSYYLMVEQVVNTAMNTRALDEKTKYLVVLALDAAKCAGQGVKVVAGQAREAGATEEEIKEVLRLAYFVSGMDVVKTSLNAFKE